MRPVCLGFAILLASVAGPGLGQTAPPLSLAEARRIIAEGNREWGRARVALDTAAFERTLAPDFYVQMPDKKISRTEFLGMISANPPGAKLVRFDASVLTVEPAPTSDGWVATIQEKLEFERADGKPRVYSLWVTRDTWKKLGDRWVVTSSEAIGDEFWRDGTKPPFRDW
jgi:Domain of unknown function (DUF4440)